MGKWDVDFEDYEDSGGGYDGPTPKRGVYTGALISLKEHESAAGNEGLEWIFEITEGDYKGWRGWVYSNMESTKWRTQQCVAAIQGGDQKKFSLEPAKKDGEGDKSKTVKKAGPVRLRLKLEEYDGEDRARIATVMPPREEDLEATPKKGKKKKKNDDDEPPF